MGANIILEEIFNPKIRKHILSIQYYSCRYKLLALTEQKYLTDGYSNLNYRVESINYGKLYTHIKVNI